ncbi:type II toxin-antitoxin system RelE/ParE family toxin [Peteryoungia desertarenae]|uniref:Type II toxin-antitoxin system RelE/ParE family toxin n=1 Tax=Peteryoungia desertarenae TaxID=1813451 RepID=A0ABX6QRU3_9HYPH|nr:type II toxin-antitoxin system RelE/ParE family toxin [Peteryoungia desertarenae]QLF71346.1 type II toxin-antitoxin system RelE/ParE family toxin [Peteryoungia desertarenae]
MEWRVLLHDEFDPEFEALPEAVRDEIFISLPLLKAYGPQLGRPWADTLKGSRFSNMKELRFRAVDGVWRLAYAFDPQRQAVLLVAGDKSGVSETRFYKRLIEKADRRFAAYLDKQKED